MKFLFFILLSNIFLFASIGKITALNGKIIVDRDKQSFEANVGFNLEEKDFVSTLDNSKVQIIMEDGTVLTLGKNSKLNINEYLFDQKNQQDSKADFKFVEGTFKSITGAIGKIAPDKFKLETKSATIGIRGTIVVGNQEKVACTQGQIAVTSAGITQVLSAGMMTTTEIGKPPTPPTKIEGNLLKEINSVGTKEENKTTNEASNNKTTENNDTKTESQTDQPLSTKNSTTDKNVTTTPVTNVLTDVINTANTTTTQASTNKIQEDTTSSAVVTAEAAKKKAEEEAAAIDAAAQAAKKKAEEEAAAIATAAEAAKKKAEEEAVAIAAAAEANRLKKAALLNVANLVSQANTLTQNIDNALQITQIATNTAITTEANASISAQSDATSAATAASAALLSAQQLSQNAKSIYSQIDTLYTQAKNSNSLDEISNLNTQIKILINSYDSILSDVNIAKNTALDSSKTVINVPFYSTSIDVLNDNQGIGTKTFTVGSGGTTVTIATYNISNTNGYSYESSQQNAFDPYMVIQKFNNQTQTYLPISNGENDDSWTITDNYNNSILSLNLTEGKYKVILMDSLPLESNDGYIPNEGTVKLYFTTSSNLTFDDSDIEKYSYISKLNNMAFVDSPNFVTPSIDENNAKFGILADSKIGTSIYIENYGYFVTISDSFNSNMRNDDLNYQSVFIEAKGNIEDPDGSSWGYWADNLKSDESAEYTIDLKSVWVSGNRITPNPTYVGTFGGQVIGSVNHNGDSGYIVLNSGNSFGATIDIGNAKITDSYINFNDNKGGFWQGSFDTTGAANVKTSGFSSTINGTMMLGESSNNPMTGALAGKYFGTTNADGIQTVKSIGGSFNMSSGGTSTANGVFKAREGFTPGGLE